MIIILVLYNEVTGKIYFYCSICISGSDIASSEKIQFVFASLFPNSMCFQV